MIRVQTTHTKSAHSTHIMCMHMKHVHTLANDSNTHNKHHMCTHQTHIICGCTPTTYTQIHTYQLFKYTQHTSCVCTQHTSCVCTQHTSCVCTQHTSCVCTPHTLHLYTHHTYIMRSCTTRVHTPYTVFLDSITHNTHYTCTHHIQQLHYF